MVIAPLMYDTEERATRSMQNTQTPNRVVEFEIIVRSQRTKSRMNLNCGWVILSLNFVSGEPTGRFFYFVDNQPVRLYFISEPHEINYVSLKFLPKYGTKYRFTVFHSKVSF